MDRNLIDALDRLESGDWDGAHGIVQDLPGPGAAWIHAHLHRIEGDLGNAGYWYRLAGREPFEGNTDEEFAALRAEMGR